jgi:hypothetical protein
MAGPGPYWITTFPGRESPITPVSFSLATIGGTGMLHFLCTSSVWSVKMGQSESIPLSLVHCSTAD